MGKELDYKLKFSTEFDNKNINIFIVYFQSALVFKIIRG